MRTLVIAALLALPALAEDVVVVLGHGEARTRPDRLVLTFRVSSNAEKAADALAKQKSKVEKAKAALDAASKERKLEGAVLADSGLEFGAPANQEDVIIMGGGAPEGAQEVHVSTLVSLTLEGADKLDEGALAEHVVALIDAAVEGGAEYAGGAPAGWGTDGLAPATVRYEFSDPDAAIEKAWDAAVENARKRAVAIATRFGRQVSEVVKIEDLSGAEEDADGEALPPGVGGAGVGAMRTSGVAAVRADVRVTFRMK